MIELNDLLRSRIVGGLASTPRVLPYDLLYAEAESISLLEAVKQSPAYYLTRTEAALIDVVAPYMATLLPRGCCVVEYGASSSEKAAVFIDAIRPTWYVPIDISAEALQLVKAELEERCHVWPLNRNFLEQIQLPPKVEGLPTLGLFTGGTVGNFEPRDVSTILQNASMTLGRGARMLVTVDINTSGKSQEKAYSADGQPLVEKFMLHPLNVLNRAGWANFNIGAFRYRPVWEEKTKCLHLSLISQADQSIQICGQELRLCVEEKIIVAKSYKYSIEAFQALACDEAGWRRGKTLPWVDNDGRCAIVLLEHDDAGVSYEGDGFVALD